MVAGLAIGNVFSAGFTTSIRKGLFRFSVQSARFFLPCVFFFSFLGIYKRPVFRKDIVWKVKCSSRKCFDDIYLTLLLKLLLIDLVQISFSMLYGKKHIMW